MLIVAIAFALAVSPLMLRLPGWTILALTVVIYSNAASVLAQIHNFKLTNYATVALSIALIGAYRLLHGDRYQGAHNFLAAGALWMGAALASLIFSQTAGASPAPLLNYLTGMALAFGLFLLIADLDRFTHALYGIAATTVFFAALTVSQTLFGFQDNNLGGLARGAIEALTTGVGGWRPSGPIEDPNYYAQMLLPGFAICMDRVIHGKDRIVRSLVFAGLAVVFATIVLTASRGAMIALAVILFLFFVRERRFLVLLPFALIAPIMAAIITPGLAERMVSTIGAVSTMMLAGGPTSVDSAVVGRINEMLAAAHLFAEHPWTGVGFGQFNEHYQAISARYDLLMRPSDRSAHSLYLETAAEQGLIGLAALAGILVMAARAISRARTGLDAIAKTDARHLVGALGIGMIGFFIASIFLHDAYPRYFWLMLAMAFAAERTAGLPERRRLGLISDEESDAIRR